MNSSLARLCCGLLLPVLTLTGGLAQADNTEGVIASPEFQRVGKLLQAAHAADDHWNTYGYALEANRMVPNKLFVALAVTAVYRSIDTRKAETAPNAGISERWVMRVAQCPEPDDEADGLTHMQYFMSQVCLACYVGNLEHDFDAAMAIATKARRHLDTARQKDPSLYQGIRTEGNPEAMIAGIEKTAGSNKRIATVGKVAAWVRKTMTQPGSAGGGGATTRSDAPPANTSSSPAGTTVKKNGQPQFQRYAGTSQTFKVTSLGNLGGTRNLPLSASGGWVTVYDSSQDRKLSFNYGETLGTKEGDAITVTFDADGRPLTLKNHRTGRSATIQDAY